MENLGYLIAAYLIVWVALFAYLFWMGGVTRGLRAELSDLRRVFGEREQAVPADADPTQPAAEVGSH